MKKAALASSVLLLGLGAALFASAPAHALTAENMATVVSFDADYYLDVDAEGRSTLRVVETIVMDFAVGAGEHGPIRELVENYDGHPTDITVESVTDESARDLTFEAESDNGYYALRIGDADVEVEGLRTYVITYTQNNVTLFPDDKDVNEFYWDVNGTEWRIPVNSATARVHIPAGLSSALTGDTACYAGALNGEQPCERESVATAGDDVVYTASSSGLSPGETLTVAIAFDDGTFVPRDTAPFTIVFLLEVVFAVIVVLLGVQVLVRRRTVFADEPGRPTIVAEYLPPKGITVVVAAIVLGKTKRAVAAQLVDLAVRRNIRIIEEPAMAGSKKPNYTLQLVSAEGLEGEERAIAKAFLGNSLKPGLTKTLKKNDTELAKDVYTVMTAAKKAVRAGGYFKPVRFSARFVPLFFGIPAFMGAALTYLALIADARELLLPSIVLALALAAVVVICATVFRLPLTAAGAELRDHLTGLRLYIRVAEKQRIEYLQSPQGAERTPVDTSDSAVMLHLYERVLPYAVLFDEEEQWAMVLGDYYENEPPEWYSGSGSFSSAAFATGISSVSSFTSAGYSGTSSDSSSGSGGGGSSGGGGGGGGGGSW